MVTKSKGNYPSAKRNGSSYYCCSYRFVCQISGHWFKNLKLCFFRLFSTSKVKNGCYRLTAVPLNNLDKILEMGSCWGMGM